MKRVMVACDKCGNIIPYQQEVEIHCLHNGTNEDSKIELCQQCFCDFLFKFIGVKNIREDTAEMVKEEEQVEEMPLKEDGCNEESAE